MSGIITVLFLTAVVVVGFLLYTLKNLLLVSSPNEVLILSGGTHAVGEKVVGYRAIRGGRAVRIPLLESVDRIAISNIPIELLVKGAYSKGGSRSTSRGLPTSSSRGRSREADHLAVLDDFIALLNVGEGQLVAHLDRLLNRELLAANDEFHARFNGADRDSHVISGSIYVPRLLELGLTLPDPELRHDKATDTWLYGEPDWQELRTVVTNHGPMSEARLAFRRENWDATAWVRETVLGSPAAAA